MRFILPFLLLALCGCRGPRQTYIPPDTPQSYFDGLPSVTVPQSPYSDAGQTDWYSIGYREGWQRGNSGVNAHSDPWYPQHQQCIRVSAFSEAHRRGFDAGFKVGLGGAQLRQARTIESLGKQAIGGASVATVQPKPASNLQRDGLVIGMRQADVLARLHDSGAVEVLKEVFPSASGWAMAGGRDCLFLSFMNGALSGISVETDSDQPKMYRHYYTTNSYSLR